MAEKLRILVVDDEKINLNILIGLLGDEYDVSVALNGEKALKLVDTKDIDLILLDIVMPEMSGYEICKILKSSDKTKEIPVIFITAKEDEISIEEAYAVGGVDYVKKPFKPRELLARVRTQLNLIKSQKKMQKLVKEQEALSDSLNHAQSITHLGNWEWHIESNTLWWSDEIYKIFGLQAQQFIPTYDDFLKYIHPDDLQKVQNAVNSSLVSNVDYQIVHRILRPDGELRYVRETGNIEKDHLGNPDKMIGTIHDITESEQSKLVLESSEKKYRDLVENSIVGVYRSNVSGKVLYVNSAVVDILGYDSSEEIYEMKGLLHYKDPKQRTELMKILSEKGHIKGFELELLDKNQKSLPVLISAAVDGDILSGMIVDMREIKKSRQEIHKLSKIVDQIDDNVMVTDVDGKITYVNHAFIEHSGFSKEEAIGKSPNISRSGEHDKSFYQDLWKIILNGEVFRGTLTNKKKNGELYYENKVITPIVNEEKNSVEFVSSGRDVTQETLMNQEMERMATIDKLTGIYNRHKFEELFTLELERSKRFSKSLSLILIDIDHFKLVNDTYGHDVGDMVLIKLSKIVEERIRKIDIFARWGGEEFLILSPETDIDSVQLLAEKLRLAVENASFEKVGKITISLGISTFNSNDSFSDLFKRADNGLYKAKESGRNQIGVE